MKMHHPFPTRADPRRRSGLLEKIWHGKLVPWFYCRILGIHSYQADGGLKFIYFPDEPHVGICANRSVCCHKRGLGHQKTEGTQSYSTVRRIPPLK